MSSEGFQTIPLEIPKPLTVEIYYLLDKELNSNLHHHNYKLKILKFMNIKNIIGIK